MKALRQWLPEGALYVLAVVLCWQELSPTCKSEVVYGPNILQDGID
jgi:hypothetical protein